MSWWTATMAVPRGTWINLGFLLILLHLMHQPVTCAGDSADYYTAAVVEFTPTHKGDNGTTTLRENSLSYVKYIEQASEQNADIIVFPEDGLTSLYMPSRAHMDSWATVVPSPLENYIPCTENRISNVSETLTRLSCAARRNHIYVVVNIAEKEFCEPKGKRCADGVSYHNTNVVFDRTGAIVARYRKVNLYMEYRFDTTEEPEIVTFDTDFGVTFGTFICFDILFWVPALNLTRMRGVSNFVYTTAWFSEAPFLTAVQTQFAWSFAENANLLVSGYHEAINGNAGSGIYLGRKGIANATITASPLHRLLISRVPKKNEPSKRTEEILIDETIVPLESFAVVEKQLEEKLNLIHLLHDNLTAYESVPLEVSMTKKLCYKDFCCDFDVRTSGPIDPRVNYRAVVYDGVRLYGAYVQAGVRVCAVIQCKNQSFNSCGSYQSSDTTFTTLNITATYPDYSNILAMPSVLDHSLFPIEHFTYTERPHDGQTSVSLALKQPTRNLVTFGLYARDFTKDKEDRP
ncbi:vanin-like protein 1 [Osmia bicornis bicornis]|uniref:vanin-like protein 1 n=1 Tax=Osmia bicornis bicornis TaxID=1437191 RepID=UPI001EAF43DF|nr:vanin-like protein 1 [Osmia bicornis bicornis]XP_029038096.2 vanin-like protein 1 [Osmia bicornis bicornis]